MHRSLRYPLAPHEQIYFLHIPKTGGTTLFNILTGYFPPEEILSLTPLAHEEPDFAERLVPARLIRSHAGYNIYPAFPRQPIYLTMVRDPVKRVVSNFLAEQRITEQHPIPFLGTFEDYITDPAKGNRQTFQIVGSQHNIRLASEDTNLSVAKVHLESFTFFGITERFDDSLQLLTYILGWDSPIRYESKNKTPEQKPEVTPEFLEIILKNNQLDIALYEFAQTLFEQRFQKLKAEVSV